MKTIQITDMTLRQYSNAPELSLSFKEKLEIAKYLDKMKVDYIETAPIINSKTDSLLLRTISSTVVNCGVSVPVGYSTEEAEAAWAAVSKAKMPRLHIIVPVSTVQMEYVCRKKPAVILAMIEELVTFCRKRCADIDFTAEDATRAEPEFLRQAIAAAVRCGATTVTVSDTAGTMLPEEFGEFLSSLKADLPELQGVRLSAHCVNEMNMSAACALSAVRAGATELKAMVTGSGTTSVSDLTRIIRLRGDDKGLRCNVNTMEVQRLSKQIEWLTRSRKGNESPFATGVGAVENNDFSLNGYDTAEAVREATLKLGYELSEDDLNKVYESFRSVADKKTVSARELEVIIASVALQVPPTYRLIKYVINTGNTIGATCSLFMEKEGKALQGLSYGDGPIDAAFLALEQIAGAHFELDDFQIQAVTEGREAMGSAVVKLRHLGKLFSGRGISTDIIGASIHAYINALNKIVYEEV